MMSQKHIGYKTWNDNFPADTLPEIYRIMEDKTEQEGGYIFCERDGVVSIEAEHFFVKQETEDAKWTIIPYMGRTLSGITLMPRLSKLMEHRLPIG